MTSPLSEPITRAATFGEAMIRVNTSFHERLESSSTWIPTVGGTELNVAAGLRILGVPAAWVSALPENALGRFIARAAAAARVDTDGIAWVDEDEGRAGLYFLEEGTIPRPSSILYDRKDAAIATVDPSRYDWPALLDGVGLLHVTGITLALSPNARRAAMDAMRTAREIGVIVSFDPNYRSRLWSMDEAGEAFAEAMPYVDILFASDDALHAFFGLNGESETLMRHALEMLGIDTITLTAKRGETSRDLAIRSVAMNTRGEMAESHEYAIEVVDRIGGGDAYAAGFLAEYLAGSGDLDRAVALGNAASAIKHTMPGDFLRATREEIESVAFGDHTGLLQR
jgi:2-dehydro-3-deoxygluconokinase